MRLLNFVYRMIGDRERAEDLVQEAFLRVHRHLHRFDRERKFSTWVYTIASNLAKNELRNRGRSPLIAFEQARPRDEDDPRPIDFEDLGNDRTKLSVTWLPVEGSSAEELAMFDSARTP